MKGVPLLAAIRRLELLLCRWGQHPWTTRRQPNPTGMEEIRTCPVCGREESYVVIPGFCLAPASTPGYTQVLEQGRAMGTITRQDAHILREFGFQLARGGQTTIISYEDIANIIPAPEGFRIFFREQCNRSVTLVDVLRIEIPRDNLENRWIFVYFRSLTNEDP